MHQRIEVTGHTADHKIVKTEQQIQRITNYWNRNHEEKFPWEPIPGQANINCHKELLKAQCGEA